MFLTLHACLQMMSTLCPTTAVITDTEIPTIIDPSATRKYPSATGSIIVEISVRFLHNLHIKGHQNRNKAGRFKATVTAMGEQSK